MAWQVTFWQTFTLKLVTFLPAILRTGNLYQQLFCNTTICTQNFKCTYSKRLATPDLYQILYKFDVNLPPP